MKGRTWYENAGRETVNSDKYFEDLLKAAESECTNCANIRKNLHRVIELFTTAQWKVKNIPLLPSTEKCEDLPIEFIEEYLCSL
jgi:hypothetical protein